ncbi:hypothetical protein CcaverHIS631_0112230 [Cutaneotrichosporon cavernicola]|nr:hypothetical protein CcaverHIS631_0112230 [Cutaneotrichosporon cavernicola]BEJ04046.1 hypothetical protein CcaverHIS641_0112210 [Cutaneotrichosporon cavernicola]
MRQDGRKNNQLRPMRAVLGELDRADGSGRFEFGPAAAALASFTGPIEVRIRDERIDGATLEVIHRPLDGIAVFNAASLAAMHAGSVGMRAVPLAVGVALVDGEYVLDPSAEEEAAADARFGFGWAFGAGVSSAKDRMDEDEEAESLWIEAEGTFTRQQFNEARELGHRGAREVFAFVQGEFESFFERQV